MVNIGKLYGLAPGDVPVRVNTDSGDPTSDFGPWPDGTVFTAWTDYGASGVGGTRITTLWDVAQTPRSTVVGSAPLYRPIFYGPDTHPGAIYLEDPSGTRWLFNPADLAGRLGGVTTVSLNDSAPAGGDVKLYFSPGPTDLDVPPVIQQLLALTKLSDVQAFLGIDGNNNNPIPPNPGGDYGAVDPTDQTLFVTGADLGTVDPSDPTLFVFATGAGSVDPSDPTLYILPF